jgi:ABC-2 type transport system permease protein
MNLVMSFVGLIATFVPIYFVSDALQPVVAESIADEGGVYFGFLIIGTAVLLAVNTSIQALPQAISSGITSGTLEALFATPGRLQELLVGMIGYDMLWASLKAVLLVVAFAAFGGPVIITGIPTATLVLVLLVLAHFAFGLVAASMILVLRTSGPLIPGLLGGFSLLGGVYYSTSVIPDAIRPLADFIPLTYGLRALRRSLLSGASLTAVASDILVLTGFAVGLLTAGALVFRLSLRFARRTGSLAQY